MHGTEFFERSSSHNDRRKMKDPGLANNEMPDDSRPVETSGPGIALPQRMDCLNESQLDWNCRR